MSYQLRLKAITLLLNILNKMTRQELKNKLQHLLSLQSENEIVEFKEANNNFDFNRLGKYFSALSNEANLLNNEDAWLVFGIEDKKHKIVGTKYRERKSDLDSLKKEIADKTSNRVTFIDIYVLCFKEGRVILFQIPPAPNGLPVSFDSNYYGRDGESLVALNQEKFEKIRSQNTQDDPKTGIIATATIDETDEESAHILINNHDLSLEEFLNDF